MENTEQHIDRLTKKMMESLPLESPGSEYTSKIMDRISGLKPITTIHQPLISRRAWGFIAIIVLSFIFYIIFGNVESLGWFEGIEFGQFSDNRISEFLSGTAISKTVFYATIMFGLFLFIQITVLKNYFDRRFQL